MMTDKHFEQVGWIGFILIVNAYLFVTISFLDINSTVYHLLNLAGALCMATNARHNKAKPLFWLNVVWALIAVIGLTRIE